MEIPCKVLNHLFVIVTMLSIGLMVTGGEIMAALNDKKRIARIFLANLVFVPLLGLLIVKVFNLPADVRAGVLLLALAPGGVNAIQFTGKVKSHMAFAAGMLFLLNIIAILFTPLLANVILPSQIKVSFPYFRIIGLLIALLLVPLLAGFSLHRQFPRLSERIAMPVVIISNVLFVAVIVLTMAVKKEAIKEIGWHLVAALLILIVGSMLIGWFLGGPERGVRRIAATNTSMRNAVLCLMLAVTGLPERDVDLVILAFMALMVPPNMLFMVYHTLKEKRSRPPAN
ncbi:MAG: bile acid:sodium symporter [Candidatus Eremiobacteraeota bacterium]|nr:bile acid:sodium symporter [Candidatus Eremiobacteraeota bacterium]